MYILTCLNILSHIANTIFIYILYSTLTSEIKLEAPHIQSIFETVAYQAGASFAFLIYASITNNTNFVDFSLEDMLQNYQLRYSKSLFYLDQSRFGLSTGHIPHL
jgi:hypothetical protein